MRTIFRAVLAALLSIAVLSIAAPAQAHESLDRPESTGSIADQRRAEFRAFASREFRVAETKVERLGGEFQKDDPIVNVVENYAHVTILADVPGRDSNAWSLTLMINLDSGVVEGSRFIAMTKTGATAARVTIADNEVMIMSGSVDGSDGAFTADAGYDMPDRTEGSSKSFDSIAAPDSSMSISASACDYGVSALCGLAGQGYCFAVCVGLALTTGPGGFACATVCGLLNTLGCVAVNDIVCD